MLSSWANNIGGFLNRNKGRIAIVAAVAIAVTAYYHYSSSPNSEEDRKNEFINEDSEKLLDDSKSKSTSEIETDETASRNNKLLINIRQQFDTAALQFLPTLRLKIFEVVDIEMTVRKIKEIRSSTITDKAILEDDLWNELKISSFTILFVTAYMLSFVCVLIRVQLHIISKSMQVDSNEFNSSDDIFSALIEKTFNHVLGTGLTSFTDAVRRNISELLESWVIKEKLNVTFQEVMEVVSKTRRSLETDFSTLANCILIRKFIC